MMCSVFGFSSFLPAFPELLGEKEAEEAIRQIRTSTGHGEAPFGALLRAEGPAVLLHKSLKH